MKYITLTKSAHTLQYFWGICAFFVVAVILCTPHPVYAEYIESFASDISIKKDATFEVVETIEYVFTEEKHGIFRCIPTLHSEKSSSLLKERYIDIDINSVTVNDGTVPYTTSTKNGEVCVQIGDANKTITGTHTYEIDYVVAGAVSYPKNGGADLYWNITGNGWEVPIRLVTAVVRSNDPILMRERACYRGKIGKTDSCQNVSETDGIITFTDGQLNSKEGMTIAQALDRSKVTYDVRERFKLFWVWSSFLTVGLSVFVISLYQYKTKFKTGRTIIPQYEPYPGVKPMYAGFLFDKMLDPRDITAGIVYLAEQGFVKIKKTDKTVFFFFEVDDYEIELVQPISALNDAFEKEILKLIFSETSVVGTRSSLHELKNSVSRTNENYLTIKNLEKSLRSDLKDQGFFIGFDFSTIFSTPFIIATAGLGVVLFFISNAMIIFGIIFVITTLAVLSNGRRTKKGYGALDHLKGFKDFLRVTETQRYIFHNAPEKNAEQFMEFLPYAIAFGVEKQWAKTFEGITIPNPSWYDGGVGASSFSAISLSQSLGGFSSAFASASGASGGSASSGGGSSGGGGGGGGGGSW